MTIRCHRLVQERDHHQRIDRRWLVAVLRMKENQPHLFEDVQKAFDGAFDQGRPGVKLTE